MKKKILIMLAYGIFTLILLFAISIPESQEKIEARTQHVMNEMRKTAEEHFPEISEELKESSLKIGEDSIRNSYEYSNTFMHKFIKSVKTLFKILIVFSVAGLLGCVHVKELRGK